VAELGSALLCAELGITPEVRDDHAAYLANWLTVLNQDKRAIFAAASQAQRAADYLRSLQLPSDAEPIGPATPHNGFDNRFAKSSGVASDMLGWR
jgi:antirestriction protein ArdC